MQDHELANEVEITYSANTLCKKFLSANLNIACLNKLNIDQKRLDTIKSDSLPSRNEHFTELIHSLKSWPKSQTIDDFTQRTNVLIYHWLYAIQNGTRLALIIECLQCIKIKTFWGNASTDKLHQLLLILLCETLHKHQQSTIDYVLHFDANTQLPNTDSIISHLEGVMNQAEADQLTGIFCIQFRASRNKWNRSKSAISELDKRIADILKQHIASDHRLYFAGDSQFDILMPKIANEAQINIFAAKLNRAFEQMLFLKHQSILVTPHIGCAYSIAGTRAPNALYLDAKLALEDAVSKQHAFVLYSDELDAQIKSQSSIEAKVIEAFNTDNLTLYFQPIVHTANKRCAGAEMLLRWSSKYGYNIYPSLTIEILNKVGKGKLFTRWLINSACRYASELTQQHQLNLYVTVNLRAEDLYDTELPHLFAQAVSLWKLDPKYIVLEITENGILEYNKSSTSVIDQLARQGFRFALDDFGTGFSSLSRLRSMPIDLIKIDQSFVQGISHSKDDYEIVQSIALLAKSLGKEVLAEGVEDQEALNMIKKLQIDKCQGFFFSKPIPFDEFVAWAKAH